MSVIPIQNPVATAVMADDVHLADLAHEATTTIQAAMIGVAGADLDMWRQHILWLKLFRDCCGREMYRRGMTVPFPPMLARGWETGDMYDLRKMSITYPGSASEAL